ncbi:hypothetical protein F4778DRAFT_752381 [Xylariomycetidae sp. FL2044]|nr:hypothetical protein F4778DRAFT_752381 [Xylariomycetidae sp. FL2044]
MATQLLKVEACHYKLDSVSDEDFQKYVEEEVTPKWVSLLKKHNIVRYTSTLTPSTFPAQFRAHLEKTRPGWTMGEFNLTLTYYVDSFDDMLALTGDPSYRATSDALEEGYIDATRGQVKIGWETTYMEDGEVVNVKTTTKTTKTTASA